MSSIEASSIQRKFIKLGVLLSIAVAVGIALWMNFSGYANCENKITREFQSPNGRRTAIVMRINCGATTPFVTSVAVRNEGEKFDISRDQMFAVKGENDIEIIWEDNSHFTIVHGPAELIYRKIVIWRTERISYRER